MCGWVSYRTERNDVTEAKRFGALVGQELRFYSEELTLGELLLLPPGLESLSVEELRGLVLERKTVQLILANDSVVIRSENAVSSTVCRGYTVCRSITVCRS